MISANNISLRVGKKALFEDVNIKFTEGNCYGLIGANGAGKSTFLKILSGQLEPTSGDIAITPGQRLSFLQKNDELTAQKEEVQKKLDELTTGNTSVLAQYQSLIWVLQYYRTGDLVTAAKTFADAGFDMIEDENIQTIISSIRQDMAGNIYQSLVQQGLQLWNGGDKTQAMDYFQASLKIQPDNPEAMFYVGRLYQESGDTENANAMFDKIVGEHGDSEYAQKASTARGY